MPVYSWNLAAPGDTDDMPPFPALNRADKATIASILGGLDPFGSNTVESGQAQVLGNVVYFDCFNCHYDGTNWQRTDTAQAATAIQVQTSGSAFTASRVWAAPGSNPIGSSWPNTVPFSGKNRASVYLTGSTTSASTSVVSSGIGVGFTPMFSTSARVTATFYMSSEPSANQGLVGYIMRNTTGVPAGGVPVGGDTQEWASQQFVSTLVGVYTLVAGDVVVTGLTIGTQYFFYIGQICLDAPSQAAICANGTVVVEE